MQQLGLIISQFLLLSWTRWAGGSILFLHDLKVEDGTEWGDWGELEMCPLGYYASGFSLKVEPFMEIGDDTALNGIRLHCVHSNKTGRYVNIESAVGSWGEWTSISSCKNGFLNSFMLRVDFPKWFLGDNTAVTNIAFTCSDSEAMLEGGGMSWGLWGSWSSKCPGSFICGLQTRVQAPQGIGDDTALNDVRFLCCNYQETES